MQAGCIMSQVGNCSIKALIPLWVIIPFREKSKYQPVSEVSCAAPRTELHPLLSAASALQEH